LDTFLCKGPWPFKLKENILHFIEDCATNRYNCSFGLWADDFALWLAATTVVAASLNISEVITYITNRLIALLPTVSSR
jgi:hypothetical protein